VTALGQTLATRGRILRAMSGPLSPAPFQAKWQRTELSERAASHEHFIDLCGMLGQPTPAEHDATGAEYTFEKCVVPLSGASRGSVGERGFVDVWWRGKFAWEYKRKDKYRDLAEAYRQLFQYREALESPPLKKYEPDGRTSQQATSVEPPLRGSTSEYHVAPGGTASYNTVPPCGFFP